MTGTERMEFVYDVRRKRESLEFEVDDFLRRRGWKSTSDTPGCIVLWQREDDGRTLLVDKSSALYMQGWFDETARQESCAKGKHAYNEDDECVCGTRKKKR